MKNTAVYKIMIFSTVMGALMVNLSSCELESFKDNSVERNNIVLNSVIKDGRQVRAYLTEYQEFADTMPTITYIEDASISLYENDSFIGELIAYKDSFYGQLVYALPDFLPSAGNTYTLIASAGNMVVKGTDSIPGTIEIQQLNIFFEKIDIYRSLYRVDFGLNFQDPPEMKNYYVITLNNLAHRSETSIIDTESPIVEGSFESFWDSPTQLYFSDKHFNGQNVSLTFYSRVNFSAYEPTKLIVNLRSVTEDYYKYCKAYDTYMTSREDYYAEPAGVYTNIENGWGAVLGYSSSYSDTIVFDPVEPYQPWLE
jgi:hypothetical protein